MGGNAKMEEQNQLNLVTEEELKDSQPNFLHVIHDGEVNLSRLKSLPYKRLKYLLFSNGTSLSDTLSFDAACLSGK